MKWNVMDVLKGLLIFSLVVLNGCGGGGDGSSSSAASAPAASGKITNVGWNYDNIAPDYSNNGITSALRVYVYYSESIAAEDIESFSVQSPIGWRWSISSDDSHMGTSTSGKPYIGGNLYYGADPNTMPLAGTWVFQLKLKNGQISSVTKNLHEPGSLSDATHQFLYTRENWATSPDPSLYVAALARFPSQGYTAQYSAANGGAITTTGLPSVRTSYLATEPNANNMFCWLYDANKTYLGYTKTAYSTVDHSDTNLLTASGELSIVPAATQSPTGNVDLSRVKYLRFVYHDGAQYQPSSFASFDHRSISSLIAVN